MNECGWTNIAACDWGTAGKFLLLAGCLVVGAYIGSYVIDWWYGKKRGP